MHAYVLHIYYFLTLIPKKPQGDAEVQPDSRRISESINGTDHHIDENHSELLNGIESIHQEKSYYLSSVVCYVDDNQRNLVSLIHVPHSYHVSRMGTTYNRSGQWYIFNDFRWV